jgi:UDP-N-acetylmuramoyl-tripeptide--D-alanyl-D-alanine ligase
VPLTLLSIKKDTEFAIVEMGANHQKEIAFLCNLAQPDYGYITNFGKAHLEGFGSAEGVIKGKSELYDYLIAQGKSIFLNADDPIQREKLRTYMPKFGFSETDYTYYSIKFLAATPFVRIEVEKVTISSKLIGRYNFPNCCAAILMGKHFNVPLLLIKQGIEAYAPKNNRSELLQKNGHHIVLDAYNANPTSMVAALENFHAMEGVNKVLFLGDMFELGEASIEEHQKIADFVSELNFENVILVGENFSKTTCSFRKFNSFSSLAEHIGALKLKNNTILIKGSRGMALERVLHLL